MTTEQTFVWRDESFSTSSTTSTTSSKSSTRLLSSNLKQLLDNTASSLYRDYKKKQPNFNGLPTNKQIKFNNSKEVCEKVVLVYCKKFLEQFQFDFFEMLMGFMVNTSTGKEFMKEANNLMNKPTQYNEDYTTALVFGFREAHISMRSYEKLFSSLKNQQCSLISLLPSNDKFKKYHAAIHPFINLKLGIKSLSGNHHTAINIQQATKLITGNSKKLWWDDRKIDKSIGIVTVSSFGKEVQLKKEMMVLLLSKTKLKDLFSLKDMDETERGLVTQFKQNIISLMEDRSNICTSDMKAMDEILNRKDFGIHSLSNNILSTLKLINRVMASTKLSQQEKFTFIQLMVPKHHQISEIFPFEYNDCTILTDEEKERCMEDNISTDYAGFLGFACTDREFYESSPTCWRCNCCRSSQLVGLLDLGFENSPYFRNIDISKFNEFGIEFFQYIFDLLHYDERMLEHQLNNTCFLNQELLEFLVERIPIIVKTKLQKTIRLSLTQKEDKKNTGNSTKHKSVFSGIDASYVRSICDVFPEILKELELKYDTLYFPSVSNNSPSTEQQTHNHAVTSIISNEINSTETVNVRMMTDEDINDAVIGLTRGSDDFLRQMLENEQLLYNNSESITINNEISTNTNPEPNTLSTNEEHTQPQHLSQNCINERLLLQQVHELQDIEFEENPYKQGGQLYQLWSLYEQCETIVHYDEKKVQEVLSNPNEFKLVVETINSYCDLFVRIFRKKPNYLHQLKYHLFDVWRQVGSLKKTMNFINEGLGKYHLRDMLIRGRNGGFDTDPNWEIIEQHLVEGFVLPNTNLKAKLEKFMMERWSTKLTMKEFDAAVSPLNLNTLD